MRLPIRFNIEVWPSCLTRLCGAYDPRLLAGNFSWLPPADFSAAISTLRIGGVFKTTFPGRHQHSNRFLTELYRDSRPMILDVGASDGSTSVDLIRMLGPNLDRYFVTDLNLSTLCGYNRRGVVYFLGRNEECILRASRRFTVYSDTSNAWFPLSILPRILLRRHRTITDWRRILLVQPALLRLSAHDPRITVEPYDVFTPWTGPRPDLIKIANLLAPEYFSDAQIKEALRVQCSNLALNGRLLLIAQEDGLERFSVLRKTAAGIAIEHSYEGGAPAVAHAPAADCRY